MSAHSIRARLSHLEARSRPAGFGPVVRIIQRGELTAEQCELTATAQSENRLVILRQIVSPGVCAVA